MPVKIQKRLQVLSLLETTREDFKKEIDKNFAKALIELIGKGITPVKKTGNRQAPYSESYKMQIRGELTFLTIKGKKVPIQAVSDEDLDSYRASDGARKQNASNAELLRYTKSQFKDKKVSPVNLKLTGDLHRSLEIDISGDNPRVTFTDEKAFWHNNLGVGKDKVKRRLLPDGSGEEFTLVLFRKILNALKEAIKKNTK